MIKRLLIGIFVCAAIGFTLFSSLFLEPLMRSGVFHAGESHLPATCKGKNAPNPPIFIPARFLSEVNSGDLNALIFRPDQCFHAGFADISVGFQIAPGIHVQNSKLSQVLIKSTEKIVPSMKIIPLESIKELSGIPAAQDVKDYYIARFKLLELFWINRTRAMPMGVSVATTVDLEEAGRAQKSGAVWIDVRSKSDFDKGHIPNAINVPYAKGDASENPLEEMTSFQKKDHFDLKLLPQDKKTRLIFSGYNVVDVSSLRAVATSFAAGWTQLYWFRQGQAVIDSTPVMTPMSIWQNLKEIEPYTASKKLIPEGALIIDTRTGKHSIEGLKDILGTMVIPYQGSDEGVPLADLNVAFLKSRKEDFPLDKLPADKSKAIILMGLDHFDWSPVKAALFAMERGYKNLYWLKSGLAGWNSAHEAIPGDYPVKD